MQDLWIWIDPSTKCNLSCDLCYTKPSHGNDDMTPANLSTILTSINESNEINIRKLHLNWRGEPLMNKTFCELLLVARTFCPQVPIEWHTNGTLIDQHLAREIIRCSCNEMIYVSIDGGNGPSHDSNRGQGTFAKSLKGLDALLNARGCSRYPRVGIYQLDMGLHPSSYDAQFVEAAKRVDKWTRVLPVGLRGNTSASGLEIPKGPCFWAGNSFCVAPNGDTYICLISHSKLGVIGNLLKDSAASVLDNARLFRYKVQASGRAGITHCADCLKPCGDAMPT